MYLARWINRTTNAPASAVRSSSLRCRKALREGDGLDVSRRKPLLAVLLLACGVGLLACGSSAEPVKSAADSDNDSEQRPSSGMSASAEIGALNADEVTRSFRSSMNAMQDCLISGAKRVEFLGGEIFFYLKINAAQKIEHIHAEKSTLGDRATEKCMFDVLRSVSWPAPEGGQIGIARNSFAFDLANDVRAPVSWEATEVAGQRESIIAQAQGCKMESKGHYSATAYIDTEGNVLSGSVTPPDEAGEAAVDCLVDIVLATKFNSPGSWPAKVTFEL